MLKSLMNNNVKYNHQLLKKIKKFERTSPIISLKEQNK